LIVAASCRILLGMILNFLRNKTSERQASDEPPHVDLDHQGRPIRVALRRIAQARRFTLRVSATTGEVVLTLPRRANWKDAVRFADRQSEWIAARLDKIPDIIPLAHGSLIPLRDEPHRIIHRPDQRGLHILRSENEAQLIVGGAAHHVSRRVSDALKREAKHDLEKAVQKYASALDVRPAGITLKDTKSRWGSCAASRRLAFSWRLILAPPFVLDYLAAHEVTHLREMNHSDRFWRLLHGLCPETERAEEWLKRHGAKLHAYR
jgi:predicted metal-dependent hydrolase